MIGVQIPRLCENTSNQGKRRLFSVAIKRNQRVVAYLISVEIVNFVRPKHVKSTISIERLQKKRYLNAKWLFQWARSIQPKLPEISVLNWMDRFGPTRKVSKKSVHLSRWTTLLGWSGLIDLTIPTHSQSQYLAVRYFPWMVLLVHPCVVTTSLSLLRKPSVCFGC